MNENKRTIFSKSISVMKNYEESFNNESEGTRSITIYCNFLALYSIIMNR